MFAPENEWRESERKNKLVRTGVTGCYIITPAVSRSLGDPAAYRRVSSLFHVRPFVPAQSRQNKMYVTVPSGSIKGEVFIT